jgi:predicted branched-subunit amino acid permease
VIGAALLIDPTWALADRFDATGPSLAAQRRFFLGAGVTLGVAWSALIAIGAVIGNRLPNIGLELAAPLCLIALVGTRIRGREHRWAAITAAITAIAAYDAPSGMGTVIAIAAGCVAGETARRWAR